jgi:hypothetical protein
MKTDVRFDVIRLKHDLLNENESIVLNNETPRTLNRLFRTFSDKGDTVNLEESVKFLVSKLTSENSLEETLVINLLKEIWAYCLEVNESILLCNYDIRVQFQEHLVRFNNQREKTKSDIKTIHHLFYDSEYTDRKQYIFDLAIQDMNRENFLECFDILNDNTLIYPVDSKSFENYIFNSIIQSLFKKVPSIFITDKMQSLNLTDTDNEIIHFLKSFIDESGYLNENISLNLSEKLGELFAPYQRQRQLLSQDEFIFNLLDFINPSYPISENLENSLYIRINHLVSPSKVIKPTYEYMIYSLLYVKRKDLRKNLLTWLNSSQMFSSAPYITGHFIPFLTQSNIEKVISDDEVMSIIIEKVRVTSQWDNFYSNFDCNFLKDNYAILLRRKNIHSIVSYLKSINSTNECGVEEIETDLINQIFDFEYSDVEGYYNDIIQIIENPNWKTLLIINEVNLIMEGDDWVESKDILVEHMENLKKLKYKLTSKDKSNLSDQGKKWKNKVNNTKNIIKLKRRIKDLI